MILSLVGLIANLLIMTHLDMFMHCINVYEIYWMGTCPPNFFLTLLEFYVDLKILGGPTPFMQDLCFSIDARKCAVLMHIFVNLDWRPEFQEANLQKNHLNLYVYKFSFSMIIYTKQLEQDNDA
jgi:hypothetical protein